MKKAASFPFGFGHEAIDEELDADDLNEGLSVIADPIVSLTLQRRKGVAEEAVKRGASVATFRRRYGHLSIGLQRESGQRQSANSPTS